MKAKPKLEQSSKEDQIRTALNAHWQASAAGDANAEHDIYDADVICDYPQSGERILGRNNLQALRSHHPGKPSGFEVKRILGNGDLWITEYTITYQGRLAYGEYYGVPQRQGRPRNAVFRGSLRGALAVLRYDSGRRKGGLKILSIRGATTQELLRRHHHHHRREANTVMDAKIEGPDTTGADPRRHRPMTITWDGMIGRLWIDDEFWGAVDVERLGSRGVYRERCSNCLNNPAAKVS